MKRSGNKNAKDEPAAKPETLTAEKHPRRISKKEPQSLVLARLVKALKKKGIKRESIFTGPRPARVYAYSIYAKNPDMLVREDVKGQKTVGRFIGGRFQALRSAKSE